MKEFKIQMYRGDTKIVIASMVLNEDLADLDGYTVRLLYGREDREIATAVVSGSQAVFRISPEVSETLMPGEQPCRIVYDGVHQVAQNGSLIVMGEWHGERLQ